MTAGRVGSDVGVAADLGPPRASVLRQSVPTTSPPSPRSRSAGVIGVVTAAVAEGLAGQCGERDRAILETLYRLRLASGLQIERLHFAELTGRSRSVSRWRVLKRLTDWRVIAPLPRRIGGAARGSAGAVYGLDVAGWRLLRLRRLVHDSGGRLRRPHTPALAKLAHTLAVSEVYVELGERLRDAGFSLDRFEVEPSYPARAGRLTPDSYVVVSSSTASDHWFVEVDLATESLPTLRRKVQAYVDFYGQGRYARLGVMPRVLVATTTEKRASRIRSQVARAPGAEQIVRVVTLDEAATHIVRVLAG